MNPARSFDGVEEHGMEERNLGFISRPSTFSLHLPENIHYLGDLNFIRTTGGAGFTGSADPNGAGRKNFILLEKQYRPNNLMGKKIHGKGDWTPSRTLIALIAGKDLLTYLFNYHIPKPCISP
jgi:hypothetical protein